MRVIITGVTRTGNLGGAAMLCATEEVLINDVDEIALASILPNKDKKQEGPDSTRIVSADYRLWLLVIFPICILLWPLWKLNFVRSLAGRLPIMRDFAVADAVADLSGIAFVDGRGLSLLCYNVALTLPAFFFDVPVHKLSQALGPLEERLNKLVGKFVLSRCTTVAARGQRSLEYLIDAGISNAQFRPDTSFALKISDEAYEKAHQQYLSYFDESKNKPLVIFSPSAVVNRHCLDNRISFIDVLAKTVIRLDEDKVNVALLAHSTDTGIKKNDDVAVIKNIHKRLGKCAERVAILDAKGEPRLARALIAQSDVFVASRFHSMIGALSQTVPVVTIGWSHKYKEAAEPFGMDQYAMDYRELTTSSLFNQISELISESSNISKKMVPISERLKEEATLGIRAVLGKCT